MLPITAAAAPTTAAVAVPAVIAATAAAERLTYPQKGEAPRERCLFRFRGIGQPGGCEPRRRFFRHRLTGGRELPQACSPLTGGFFFAPAERGTRTAAGVFALTGRLLSLHRLSGVRELR